MVLGVCAAGVAALYLVPGVGTPTSRVGVSAPARSLPRSSATPTVASYTTAAEPFDPATPAETASKVQATSTRSVAGEDSDPPEPVTDLAVRSADVDQVRLGWAPASDDVGVAGYRVWLNGYEVENTTGTEVTLAWFNDDSTTHVVVVRAVDAAGNQSPTTALLLMRPDAGATATPAADRR